LFRQQFRRDLKSGRFTMEFAPSASEALVRAAEIREPSLTFRGPATTQYSEAFAKLEAGDAAAMPAFAALVGAHASDALAGFHLRQLLNGAKSVRIQLE
jgi:hypothetical protein